MKERGHRLQNSAKFWQEDRFSTSFSVFTASDDGGGFCVTVGLEKKLEPSLNARPVGDHTSMTSAL